VETRIRASGVSAFSVSVVDSSAPSTGRVVGTCDRGAKKLLYTSAKASKKTDPIITECKDGSEPVRGDCKK
jgi:hypothetical protein